MSRGIQYNKLLTVRFGRYPMLAVLCRRYPALAVSTVAGSYLPVTG